MAVCNKATGYNVMDYQIESNLLQCKDTLQVIALATVTALELPEQSRINTAKIA